MQKLNLIEQKINSITNFKELHKYIKNVPTEYLEYLDKQGNVQLKQLEKYITESYQLS